MKVYQSEGGNITVAQMGSTHMLIWHAGECLMVPLLFPSDPKALIGSDRVHVVNIDWQNKTPEQVKSIIDEHYKQPT